jgi:hypothetical protein
LAAAVNWNEALVFAHQSELKWRMKASLAYENQLQDEAPSSGNVERGREEKAWKLD